ncbi:hypothetical protein SKAU_G00308260 [Synaphobranchus kaupii]|uniref:Uncharacterized protein n=1 Tax=Synaphobranchus kaupii TaxID=118154 RepID=A0A9Q1IKZ8_SYNKA|nr:hypothetical protein SKAU_G00308260 [Synaphobranchus kaupii]
MRRSAKEKEKKKEVKKKEKKAKEKEEEGEKAEEKAKEEEKEEVKEDKDMEKEEEAKEKERKGREREADDTVNVAWPTRPAFSPSQREAVAKSRPRFTLIRARRRRVAAIRRGPERQENHRSKEGRERAVEIMKNPGPEGCGTDPERKQGQYESEKPCPRWTVTVISTAKFQASCVYEAHF